MNRVVETFFVSGNAAPVYKLDNGVFLYPIICNDRVCRYLPKDKILAMFTGKPEDLDKFNNMFKLFE